MSWNMCHDFCWSPCPVRGVPRASRSTYHLHLICSLLTSQNTNTLRAHRVAAKEAPECDGPARPLISGGGGKVLARSQQHTAMGDRDTPSSCLFVSDLPSDITEKVRRSGSKCAYVRACWLSLSQVGGERQARLPPRWDALEHARTRPKRGNRCGCVCFLEKVEIRGQQPKSRPERKNLRFVADACLCRTIRQPGGGGVPCSFLPCCPSARGIPRVGFAAPIRHITAVGPFSPSFCCGRATKIKIWSWSARSLFTRSFGVSHRCSRQRLRDSCV